MKKTTTKTTTHTEDHEEVAAAHSTDEYVGTSMAVYWSKGGGGSWQEGKIIAQDGKDEVQVRYNDSTESWHNLAKTKYKLCPSQTHANQSIIWECIGCRCLNKTGSAPTARSSCTKCKREFGLPGVLLGGKRRRTEITPMERKIQSKQTRQEGSPALVQMHGTTDQRGEMPTDTESMFAASKDGPVAREDEMGVARSPTKRLLSESSHTQCGARRSLWRLEPRFRAAAVVAAERA